MNKIKWSILVECDAENFSRFNKLFVDAGSLHILMDGVVGILKVDSE